MTAPKAIGAIELSSIGLGYQVQDEMLKAANVEILIARTICSGKYLIVVAGEVAPVKAAVEAGRATARNHLTDHSVIPHVHWQVLPAIRAVTEVEDLRALGIIETFGLPSCIVAADAAVKAAAIELIEVRLARALGGKAFTVFTGEVAAVRSAVKAGEREVRDTGLLLGSVVIPQPHTDLLRTIL